MIFERRYETVEYPAGDGWIPEFAGFQARVMVNPTGAELRHEQKLWSEYFIPRKDADGNFVPATADAEAAWWTYVAPRIPEWNYELRELDGTVRTIPPPSESWESVFELPPSILSWLALCVHTAHMPDRLGKLQGKTGELLPNGATTTDSTPPTPIRRKSSSKPAGTKSTA